ncbi:MAG: RCC1 domain-containing protein [Myxococcota bacterium]
MLLTEFVICAAFEDGRSACWMDDPAGERPHMGFASVNLPRVAEVDVRHGERLFRTPEGEVFRSFHTDDQLRPLTGFGPIVNLHQGCALDGDGKVACLAVRPSGNGLERYWRVAEKLPPVDRLLGESIPAEDYSRYCVRTTTGDVHCLDYHGRKPAKRQPKLRKITAWSRGRHHVCRLSAKGTVSCSGRYRVDANHLSRWKSIHPDPKHLARLTDVVEIASGENHTCARTKDQAIHCWGGNYFGQLGDDTLDARPSPVQVLHGADALWAGRDKTCARTGSTVKCWGLLPEHTRGTSIYEVMLRPVNVLPTDESSGPCERATNEDSRSCVVVEPWPE